MIEKNLRLQATTLELHYYFTDSEHKIDAFIQNKCEHELLMCMKEISKYFEINYSWETELTLAGGIRKFFHPKIEKLNSKDKKQIYLDVRTAILIAIINGFLITPLTQSLSLTVTNIVNNLFQDKELNTLEKEKLREEIKSLKLDNEKKQMEISNNSQITKTRSNFYEILYQYPRLEGIAFIEENQEKQEVNLYKKINQSNFKNYIIESELLTDLIIENASIAIVSPVLTKNNKNIKWKGVYNGELVTLTMKSHDFITSIDEGLIEFKNGFIIICNLRIERQKNIDQTEKRKYIVTEVINYIVDGTLIETSEGRTFKLQKKFKEDEQYLPFDQLD